VLSLQVFFSSFFLAGVSFIWQEVAKGLYYVMAKPEYVCVIFFFGMMWRG
jgi:hypothetical protein